MAGLRARRQTCDTASPPAARCCLSRCTDHGVSAGPRPDRQQQCRSRRKFRGSVRCDIGDAELSTANLRPHAWCQLSLPDLIAAIVARCFSGRASSAIRQRRRAPWHSRDQQGQTLPSCGGSAVLLRKRREFAEHWRISAQIIEASVEYVNAPPAEVLGQCQRFSRAGQATRCETESRKAASATDPCRAACRVFLRVRDSRSATQFGGRQGASRAAGGRGATDPSRGGGFLYGASQLSIRTREFSAGQGQSGLLSVTSPVRSIRRTWRRAGSIEAVPRFLEEPLAGRPI
jgi:hypothetical protein